jgi:hypothetical protein
MYGHTMGYPGFEDEVNHLLIEYARKRQVILLNNEALLNNYKAHALYLIHHAVEYFKDTILLKLSSDLEIFKACRLVNPMAIKLELSNPVAIQRFQAEFFRLIYIVLNITTSEYDSRKFQSLSHQN